MIDLAEASAHQVESLVRRAIILRRKYEGSGRLTCQRIENPMRHGVTWAKLVRGRWCLIASANVDQSQLSVWEIQSNGDTHLVSRAFLDGPVLDGTTDESLGGVNIAITIGTT